MVWYATCVSYYHNSNLFRILPFLTYCQIQTILAYSLYVILAKYKLVLHVISFWWWYNYLCGLLVQKIDKILTCDNCSLVAILLEQNQCDVLPLCCHFLLLDLCGVVPIFMWRSDVLFVCSTDRIDTSVVWYICFCSINIQISMVCDILLWFSTWESYW